MNDELEGSRCLFLDFLNVVEECFLTKLGRLLDRIILTAGEPITDPKTSYSQHKVTQFRLCMLGTARRKPELTGGPFAFQHCKPGHLEDFGQKMCMIFGNSLFRGTAASRESSKIPGLGKGRLFWLKAEAQRGVTVGLNSQRGRKGK